MQQLYVVLTATAIAMVVGHPTPCNQGNYTMCVDGVRFEFTRDDYFFGVGYFDRCPNGPADGDFYCMNPDVERQTIASRLLKVDNFNTNTIEQFLRMRWNTDPGYYRACGHYFNVEPFAMGRDLDNTHTIYYDSWILSHRPSVAFNYTPGHTYTLMAYDAGYLRLSGLWVNIQTGDTSTGQEIYPHQAPRGGMWEIRNPQVYALFRQPNGTHIRDLDTKRDEIEAYIRSHQSMYDASTFIEANDLYGPVAVGYLVVKADAFSIQSLVDRGVFNNCPYLNSRNRHLMMALEVIGFRLTSDNSYRDYRGPFLRGLEMNMEITYSSPEAHFDSCCKHIMYQSQVWTVDSLSEDPVNSVLLRYPPMVKMTPVNMNDQLFGLGKLYMMVLLDITEASVNMTGANTTVEWQVVNMPGDNVGAGEEVVPYRPPMVRKYNETRIFAFLLLRQIGEIDAEYMWTYTNPSSCDGPDAYRCNFNLGMMINFLNLKLASVSVFYMEQDDYSRAVMYGGAPSTYGDNLGRPMMSQWMACMYVPEFDDPCPRPGCDPYPHDDHDHHDHSHDHDDHEGHDHASNSTDYNY